MYLYQVMQGGHPVEGLDVEADDVNGLMIKARKMINDNPHAVGLYYRILKDPGKGYNVLSRGQIDF